MPGYGAQPNREPFNGLKQIWHLSRLLHWENKTTVSSDASSFGIGAVFNYAEVASGETRPVAYASRSMTETERRYAQNQKRGFGYHMGT